MHVSTEDDGSEALDVVKEVMELEAKDKGMKEKEKGKKQVKNSEFKGIEERKE